MGQRPAALTPDRSPRHFWGAELRRTREERNLSCARLGALVHRNASHIAHTERGERVIPREFAEDCDSALNAAGALVRLHDRLFASTSSHVAPARPHEANFVPHVADHVAHLDVPALDTEPLTGSEGTVLVPARTPDGREIYVSIPRRAFLSGTVAAAGALTLGTAAPGAAAVTPAKALPGAMLAPEVNPVSHFAQMKRVLMDNDNMFGPSQVIATVEQQISTMQALRQNWRGEDARRLISVQTQFADLLGWLYQDSGQHDNARYWIDRSQEWAHMAREPHSAAFMLVRRSQLAADVFSSQPDSDYAGSFAADAVDAAEAALGMSDGSHRVGAIASTFAAHGHALRGDGTASARAFDQARDLLDRATADEPSDYGLFLSPEYISVYEGHSLAALGEYASAAAAFQTALAGTPDSYRRDRGTYLAWQALAYAGGRDIDNAVAAGTHALRIAHETKSSRILSELVKLDRELASFDNSPQVSEYRSTLAAIAKNR